MSAFGQKRSFANVQETKPNRLLHYLYTSEPAQAPHQQRQAPAMIEMGMGEKNDIDLARIETETARVLLIEFARTLIEPAIDQDAQSGRFDEMAGTGDAAIGAVKRQLQGFSFPVS